jgi:hypothetical protein
LHRALFFDAIFQGNPIALPNKRTNLGCFVGIPQNLPHDIFVRESDHTLKKRLASPGLGVKPQNLVLQNRDPRVCELIDILRLRQTEQCGAKIQSHRRFGLTRRKRDVRKRQTVGKSNAPRKKIGGMRLKILLIKNLPIRQKGAINEFAHWVNALRFADHLKQGPLPADFDHLRITFYSAKAERFVVFWLKNTVCARKRDIFSACEHQANTNGISAIGI